MKIDGNESRQTMVPAGRAALDGANLRTLEALFRHPTAHNLEWVEVFALFGKIGTIYRKANAKFALELAGEHYTVQKAHTKDLASSEVIELRQFLQRAGWPTEASGQERVRRSLESAVFVAVVDHHGAKIYRIEPGSSGASAREIWPYDPHHFLHHLTHKDQSRDEGQRAPEDHSYYRNIGDALAEARKILVVGHGKGKSNAARHLVEYLRVQQPKANQRLVREVEADLPAITMPQLLQLAEQEFSGDGESVLG